MSTLQLQKKPHFKTTDTEKHTCMDCQEFTPEIIVKLKGVVDINSHDFLRFNAPQIYHGRKAHCLCNLLLPCLLIKTLNRQNAYYQFEKKNAANLMGRIFLGEKVWFFPRFAMLLLYDPHCHELKEKPDFYHWPRKEINLLFTSFRETGSKILVALLYTKPWWETRGFKLIWVSSKMVND